MLRNELKPIMDSKKSFYGKANVEINGNTKSLISYNTKVAEIAGGQLRVYDTYSATTLRHIKEFAYQNGFGCMNKKQIENYLV